MLLQMAHSGSPVLTLKMGVLRKRAGARNPVTSALLIHASLWAAPNLRQRHWFLFLSPADLKEGPQNEALPGR